MGVGTPANLLESIARGVDMFDCVMPTRNARNGTIFTQYGKVNLRNSKWKYHHRPLEKDFPSDLCQKYHMSYVHHLFKSNELFGMTLASEHNLQFYMWLMKEVREHIKKGTYATWYPNMVTQLESKI